MDHKRNEPAVETPPTNADLTSTPGTAEVVGQTKIGKFKIPTETLRAYTMVFALIAIWVFFHYSTGRIFFEPRNFSNLMRQTSVIGVLAVGMLMVIVTGHIDLSVGSIVGNGMSLKNVEPYMQNIIKGAILVAAVGLDMAGRKRG